MIAENRGDVNLVAGQIAEMSEFVYVKSGKPLDNG